jgi:biopolymer transport protein ExbD
MRAIYNVAENNKDMGNDAFASALRKSGEGIAVKADKDTPYSTIHNVLDNLQTLKLNKFSLMTALKTEED